MSVLAAERQLEVIVLSFYINLRCILCLRSSDVIKVEDLCIEKGKVK